MPSPRRLLTASFVCVVFVSSGCCVVGKAIGTATRVAGAAVGASCTIAGAAVGTSFRVAGHGVGVATSAVALCPRGMARHGFQAARATACGSETMIKAAVSVPAAAAP